MAMILKNRIIYTLFAAVAFSAFSQNTIAASSAAYGSTAGMPTIYSKNSWRSVAPPVVGRPPSTATITIVNYSWAYSFPRPSGHQVLLCDNIGSVCADVSSSGSGSVSFIGTGVKANTPVRFYSRVIGSGRMSPLYGGVANVAVNYVW